jgi:hypothetical protein
MSTALLEQLRASGQDFEWYPTTNEIIGKLIADIRAQKEYYDGYGGRGSLASVLDIGAGNGKVLRALRDARYSRYGREENTGQLFTECYAIEKATPLLEQLDADVFVIGTEFHEQSLVSKQVDVTFCNPPYSEFTEWATKIIRESASKLVYLVIPTRWQDSLEITAALAFRDATAEIVGEFSFMHSEDRAARAQVNLIRIKLSPETDDAFDRFFSEQFGELKAKFEGTRTKSADRRDAEKVDHDADKQARFRQLVVGPSYPERMVELYNAEMDHVRRNYDLVAQLDADLLKEFDITPSRILGCLKSRLTGLRNTYWQELIRNMSQVTNRLCSKKRKEILQKLNQSGAVDFTLANIHAVVIWVLKNSNLYIDAQLIEVFEDMVEAANVRNYKSNQRVFTHDRWRYNEAKPTHIALEYRLVLNHCGGIDRGYSYERGLSERGAEFIGDLITVARNLGFECITARPSARDDWKTGETRTFDMTAKYEVGDRVQWGGKTRKTIIGKYPLPDGKWQYRLGGVDPTHEYIHEKLLRGEPLFEVRAFLNSNLHVRLNQKFALALNVEYGRLKGWLKNGAEAADELGEPEAAKFFSSNLRVGSGSLFALCG